MATKKQHFAFYENALQYILSIGAKNRHIGELSSRYQIETKVGILFIALETPEKGEIYSICCRFDDEKKAIEVLGKTERLNPYSGKWNFHTRDANYLLQQFKSELTPLLISTKIN